MNELTQEIRQFEQGVSQLTTALKNTEQALSRCRALEEVLVQTMDFLVLLGIEGLTQEQRAVREGLLLRIDPLLSPSP